MRFLITGTAGFIGFHAAAELLARVAAKPDRSHLESAAAHYAVDGERDAAGPGRAGPGPFA